jgi:rhodanese-related sulfurtransferase
MRMIFRQSLVIILVAAVAALVSAFFQPGLFAPRAALASDETTWAQVAKWRQADASGAGANAPHILILDARPGDAYRAAHVPGALPLNEARWEQLLPAIIESLRDNTRIVVYCDDTLCEASRGVAIRLRRELALDESGVFVVKGGWREWLETRAAAAAPAPDGNASLLIGPTARDAAPEKASQETGVPRNPAPAKPAR